MAETHGDRLLRVLLIWTAITLLPVWLPLLRGPMDGPSYQWQLAPGVGGSGVAGGYWLLLLVAGYGLMMLYLGWRGAQAPFHWMLLLWHFSLAGLLTWAAAVASDEMRLRGDTLGIDVSLAWVGPVLFGGFAVAALVWVWRDLRARRARPVPAWTRANRGLLILALLLLPVELALLRFGEPHGLSDQLGVGVILLQWLLVNYALAPHWEERG